jgi:phosphoribosylamine---glycine ligase
VLAAAGYPAAPRRGDVISGLAEAPPPGVERFHAGTARRGGDWITAGGRVLSVCAHGEDLEAARRLAYAEAGRISFEGKQLRTDIGARRKA